MSAERSIGLSAFLYLAVTFVRKVFYHAELGAFGNFVYICKYSSWSPLAIVMREGRAGWIKK